MTAHSRVVMDAMRPTSSMNSMESRISAKYVLFLIGLFILCACVLMLQIIETRILSVLSYYHLAFLIISMAMFGLTAGSLIIFFNPNNFSSELLLANLSWIGAAFALTIPLSTVLLSSIVLVTPLDGLILSVVQLLMLIVALLPAYVF